MPLPRFPTSSFSPPGLLTGLRGWLLLALALAATLAAGTPLQAQACTVTHEDAARALYVQVLEREGEAAGVRGSASSLAAGTSVRAIVKQMAQSPEYHARFIIGQRDSAVIRTLYRTLLAREADPGAWGWLSLAAANGWDWLTQKLIDSDEYLARFGERAVPGEPIVAWDCARAGLALEPASAAPVLERDLCLTISAGSGAAYECGDLRLAHALPTIRTLDKPRTPVLLYNSQHADPQPIVGAYLTLPPGVTADRVTASLVSSSGAVWASGEWPAWAPGEERRIALTFKAREWGLATGVHAYTLQVSVRSGANTVATYSRWGDLGLVNRSNSPYGAGWWVAGLEKIHFLPDGRLFWVGGDGSFRVYRTVEGRTDRWAAAHVADRPDTLYAATYPDATYERRLPGDVKVAFSAAGLHVGTSNIQGHHTKFGYYNDGKLHSIYVPWQPGYNGQNLRYGFEYDPTGTWLRQVTAPDLYDNRSRTVRVGSGSDGRVGWIEDPDTSLVQFSYAASRPWVPETRTDRRQTVTRFGYDAGGKLASSKVEMQGTGDDLQAYFVPHETRGIEAAVRGDSVFTIHEGPRLRTICPFLGPCISPAGDYSRFWIDRWGAPRRIVNPLGHATVLTRGNSRLPALVTRMRAPNGLETTAEYTARGNVLTSTVHNPLGDGRNAITSYAYDDPAWPDFVTQITMPEKEVVRFGYHTIGLRAWVQPGTDMSRRVNYLYNGLLLVDSVDHPVVNGQNAAEVLRYDQWGNLQKTGTTLGHWTEYQNDTRGRTWKTLSPIDGVSVMVQEVTFYPNTDHVEYAYTVGPDMNGSGQQTITVRNVYDAEGRPQSVARRSDPDPNGINWVTTQFRYDKAGRQVAEIAPDGMVDSTFYDPAGNPVRRRTRNFAELLRAAGGDPAAAYIVTRYDALNRPYEHITPAVHYLERRAGVASNEYFLLLKQRPYPHYANDGGTGLRITGDTVRFSYDLMGNMTRAENHDSWIRRSYYPNGLLKGDTLKVRTLAELAQVGDSTSHAYALLHVYDLNGRRRELHHPAQLAPQVNGAAPLPTRFGYDPHLGTLSSVTDPLGNEFRYEYDSRGQQQALSLPGGIRETYGYDADGNLTSHRVYNGAPYPVAHRYPGNWIRDETLEYDRRGKMLETRNLYGNRDAVSSQYSGLGHMVQTRSQYYGYTFDTDQSTLYVDTETPRHDALGNIHSMYRSGALRVFQRTWLDGASAHNSHDNTAWTYQPGTGRLLLRTTPTGVDSTHYDPAGNIVFTNQTATVGAVAYDRAAFYDGEGRLRVVDSRRVENFGDKAAPFFRVFEEYRYDAVGRRVLVHTRKDCKNVSQDLRPCAVGTLRRTVWDGSAELYDIQVPTSSDNTLVNVFFSTAELESDTNPVRSNLGNWSGFDPHPMYGRVAYTYGHAIDKPLSIIRMNYADHPYGSGYLLWAEPFAIVPHWNMRGAPQTGTYANGARHRCLADNSRCVALDWPGGWFPYNPVRLIPEHWHGSLLSEKRDGSGLLYRRNRYYDPSSGRFTQEDPIGLAGGLNVYGFAAGDPVSFADPFGLRVCFKGNAADQRTLRRATERVVGATVHVDKGGCVTGVGSSTDRRRRALGNRLRLMASRAEEYAVGYTSPEFSSVCANLETHYCPTDRAVEIDRAELSRSEYPAQFPGCGIFGYMGFGPVVKPTIMAAIAHELLGHGWAHATDQNLYSERIAIRAENVYATSLGRRARCVD